jgi:tRNA(fMet)-specific endonuclease VapC
VEVKLAVDTNAYGAAARSEPKVSALLRAADRVILPFVALAELRAGFAAGTIGRRNEAALTRFLAAPRVEVQYADEQTTHHYAALFAQLRRQGTPIPTNDLWIAALVLQHDLVLCTSDSHFDKLPQIARA